MFLCKLEKYKKLQFSKGGRIMKIALFTRMLARIFTQIFITVSFVIMKNYRKLLHRLQVITARIKTGCSAGGFYGI
jgi:hypothetical protein